VSHDAQEFDYCALEGCGRSLSGLNPFVGSRRNAQKLYGLQLFPRENSKTLAFEAHLSLDINAQKL
jgi:hypothetical protein